MRVPRPVHSGHAPNGELNENDRGSSSSKDSPSLRQTRCSLNSRSRSGSSAGASTNSRFTMPPASPSAVSTESVSRRRAEGFTARRSTTTSMVCFCCFLSVGDLGELMHRAIHPGPAEALGLQLAEQVRVLALALAHHRGQHLEAGSLAQLEDAVHDLLRGLSADRLPALGAVRLADACEEQAQVVVDLGDRAHRGARVAGRGLLVDGHRRGQPVDEVDIRLVHLAEELPGVGARVTPRSVAGPRRRSCRTRGWTSPSPTAP